jgi:hypothetical protein
MRGRNLIPLLVPAVWCLTALGTANAATALQGSDKSYGVLTNTRVEVCDMESDGHGVHTDAHDWYGNSYRADDQNGSTAGCNRTTAMGGPGIYNHRTVEEVTGFDYKGDWDYH